MKAIGDKFNKLSELYFKKIKPNNENALNISIIQPIKSLIRYHRYKKAYNKKYSYFLTFCNFINDKGKAFGAVYLTLSFYDLDIALKSVIGGNFEPTEYQGLV
jgi:hypothetical protein